ncbi:MAG: sulfurtransferase [Geobacteraceae bacterium]|nr:sulfurtransferase [Geobacteraceae bacterium]NTW80939.1 sulfurtransferase [Geobacteraceae bacterium]
MSEKIMKKSRVLIAALLGTVMIAALTLWGCGTSSYDDPNASITTTKTASALIDAATLKQWMDEGKVNNNDPASRDRVVVITVSPAANYATHIPGAQLLKSDSELLMTRMEGVATSPTMMLDGSSIDALVKKFCINKNTTIVFSAGKGYNFAHAARAYFTFRYWGFPKERLKFLNGGDNAWEDTATANNWGASYALTTVAPTVTPSTFSVKNFYTGSTTNFNYRYSIGEMLALVDKINAGTVKTDATGVSIMDVRGATLPTVFIQNTALAAGVPDDYNLYATIPSGKTAIFKNSDDIKARLVTFGITASKSMNYTYCVSGVRASLAFFVLDGILGWPVTLYDGSWDQWSSYASTATANKVAAAWQTDALSSGTAFSRTSGSITTAGTKITLDPISNAMFTSITDPRANQILNEDKAYFTSGGTTTTTSTGGGGGSGSGC